MTSFWTPDRKFLSAEVEKEILASRIYRIERAPSPFILALLKSFLLTRPVTCVEKLKLGRALSVLIAMAVAFSGLRRGSGWEQ